MHYKKERLSGKKSRYRRPRYRARYRYKRYFREKRGRKKRRAGRQTGLRMKIIIIAGCALLALIFGMSWSAARGNSGKRHALVSESVLAYESLIRSYADSYGIGDYYEILEAMMQQESGGQGTDVMQSSESAYNTAYPKNPGSIDDPEYSIDCGVHYMADCLEMAGCRSVRDTDRLKLALQGYNYGSYYITWALENYGGYSEENALEFSESMKQELGWSVYGDPDYPQHVLRYYED